MNRLVDANITRDWWEQLLADDSRMMRWLKKLQVTELDGYVSNMRDVKRFNADRRLLVQSIFTRTAYDELRHSDLLIKIIKDRGHELDCQTIPPSIYWDEMEKQIVDLKTCCAVYHLGERLAAERFEVIRDHAGTPSDIKWFIDQALPDEAYHAVSFAKLAGADAIEDMLQHHKRALSIILTKV